MQRTQKSSELGESKPPSNGHVSVSQGNLILLGELDEPKVPALQLINLLPELVVFFDSLFEIARFCLLCPFQVLNLHVLLLSTTEMLDFEQMPNFNKFPTLTHSVAYFRFFRVRLRCLSLSISLLGKPLSFSLRLSSLMFKLDNSSSDMIDCNPSWPSLEPC